MKRIIFHRDWIIFLIVETGCHSANSGYDSVFVEIPSILREVANEDSFQLPLWSKNPIISNLGVNDPHIRIFDEKAYLYASDDRLITNNTFDMNDWMVWFSKDLVNWTLERFLTPTDEYDMAIFLDDDGYHYIIFVVWDFFMVCLNDDMISLAETPRKIKIHIPIGPCGKGKTDDKLIV